MIRTFFILTQISICLASGPKIVAEVDHDLQGSADLKSCVDKTTEPYILQKDDPSDCMPSTSSQIFQLCLASSNPKITDQSDQKVLGPFINISDPTTPLPEQGIYSSVVAFSTATPRPTTIVWSWWRMTNNARRESIGLKPPSSMPTINSDCQFHPTINGDCHFNPTISSDYHCNIHSDRWPGRRFYIESISTSPENCEKEIENI